MLNCSRDPMGAVSTKAGAKIQICKRRKLRSFFQVSCAPHYQESPNRFGTIFLLVNEPAVHGLSAKTNPRLPRTWFVTFAQD